MTKILLASLVGALACVAWTAMSWMMLEWHNSVLHEFRDESAVAAVLKSNTEDELKHRDLPSGIFVLRGTAPKAPETPASNAKPGARVKTPPEPLYAFAIIRPGERHVNLGLNLAYVFGRSFVACLILAFMLSWTMRLDYLQRVLFCVLGGVFTALVADFPMFIWFEAPLRYLVINFADRLCEWTFAGLVIAGFVDGRNIWETIR
jgi:hypothetical protein